MSQVLSTPIRQSTGRCVLFGGNFAVLQFLCNPKAFWSVVAYSCSADFPFSWPSRIFYFTVGVDGTQSVVGHVDRHSAAFAGMRLPSWRGSSLQSCRTKYVAASSVDRGVGQEIDVWQHNIRAQSRRLPCERCRSVPPGRQVAELSRLETAPD